MTRFKNKSHLYFENTIFSSADEVDSVSGLHDGTAASQLKGSAAACRETVLHSRPENT